MKYLKKLTSLCVMLVLVIGLVGCGGKSPSQAVSDSLDAIKKGESKEFTDSLNLGDLQENDDDLAESVNKLLDLAKNIDYKINSEKKDGDTATVNVTVNGPDFTDIISKIVNKAVAEILSKEGSGKKLSSEEKDELFIKVFTEVLNSSENTERTMDIDLVKENNEWKVKDEKQLVKLIVNLDEDSLDKLFKK